MNDEPNDNMNDNMNDSTNAEMKDNINDMTNQALDAKKLIFLSFSKKEWVFMILLTKRCRNYRYYHSIWIRNIGIRTRNLQDTFS